MTDQVNRQDAAEGVTQLNRLAADRWLTHGRNGAVGIPDDIEETSDSPCSVFANFISLGDGQASAIKQMTNFTPH